MKNVLLFIGASLLSAKVAFGQVPQPQSTSKSPVSVNVPVTSGTGKITGVVLDSETKKPVEYATIALLESSSGRTVNGTVTDDKGRYALQKVAAGTYTLAITFLGYEFKKVPDLKVTEKEETAVGAVMLVHKANTLGEVEVVGERQLVEDRVDRLVYNAEKDLTNAGGTATEVMQKVPGVRVDLEGNISLRGSSNIRVLINNKPSAMLAANVADALRQIPADQIKSVEVITSSSAKYDAEGTAGIININTKKNTLQGLNGTVNGTYGNRIKSLNGNLGYQQGKIGLNAAMGQSWRNNPVEARQETFYKANPNLDQLSQNLQGRREGHFQFLQLGADYELSSKSSLAGGIRMQTGQFAYQTSQETSLFQNQAPVGGNNRLNRNEFDNLSYDINLDYNRQFTRPGHELSILGLLSRNNRQNDNFADVRSLQDQLDLREQNLNEAFNDEKTLQLDYTHPFKNKQLLEIGSKVIQRYVESDFRFLVASPAEAPLVVQPKRTDVFSYQQDVAAGYATYELKLNNHYQVKVGTRYEYTWVAGEFTSSNTAVQQKYGNLIPSLAISRGVGKNQTVKFNYTKRIQRPQLSFLNPYENRADTFNIKVGNPTLRAEITNAYELGYSRQFEKGASINTSFFWRQTDNAIQAYTLPTAQGVNYTRFGNIGRVASYGVSLFGSTKFLEKGNLSSNTMFYYANLQSQNEVLQATNGNLVFTVNLNASYAFPNGFSAQAFGEYNSPRVTLQGRIVNPVRSNFAIRKEIMKKRGSLGLGVDNPFAATLKQKTIINSPFADQATFMYIYARQFRVNGSYKIGKTTATAKPRRKKRIDNDDAKSDDEANG